VDGGSYTLTGASPASFTASGDTQAITNVTPGELSLVKNGDGATTTDSDAEPITLSQAATPSLVPVQPTSGRATGSIPTTDIHELSTDNVNWTRCTGETEGLVPAAYYVRVAASGATLASDSQRIIIEAYVPSGGGGGGTPVSYLISISVDPATAHGSVKASESRARAGDVVVLTLQPQEGYETVGVTVTDSRGNPVPVIPNPDGTCSFTMPATAVTVTPSFEPVSFGGGDSSEWFVDVPEDAWYYEAVKWAVDKKITNGIDETHFGPDETCTRAQMVTFLWRAMGEPEPETTECPFFDVPDNAYYTKAVLWAAEQGITNGTDETHFDPDDTVDRAQTVTFLCRALKGEATGENPFVDVSPDAWYYDAVSWAEANGITNGTDETHFSPDDDCTRAQIVTFLYRAMGLEDA
jgi:hypothetical protein